MSVSLLVIGLGNRLRGDDAAALAAVAALRAHSALAVREHEGEAVDLLDVWAGADAVIVVDALRSGAAPGTIHRFDASHAALPAAARRCTSHTIAVADAIELARSLGSLPRLTVVYGIEAARFDAGAPLSEPVAAAVPTVVEAVRLEGSALLYDRR